MPGVDDRLASLLARADRAVDGRPVEEVVAQVRAIVGPRMIPVGEKAAQVAFDKLRSGKRPTVAELTALELVIRMLRPAPLSHHGVLDPLPSGKSTYNSDLVERWTTFRDAVKPYVYSVGRIDHASGGPDAAAGTGFLVDEDLLLTNRHVVDALSFGTQVIEAGTAVVQFYKEEGLRDAGDAVPITGVAAVHETLDMALLRVSLPDPRPFPEIASDVPGVGAGVVAIGYPWEDRSNPLFAPVIFAGKYGVKRGAVGEVMEVRGDRFLHDCSTLGGNSGSPVFDLERAAVVGLHCSGMFMYRNEAVPAPDVAAFVKEVAT